MTAVFSYMIAPCSPEACRVRPSIFRAFQTNVPGRYIAFDSASRSDMHLYAKLQERLSGTASTVVTDRDWRRLGLRAVSVWHEMPLSTMFETQANGAYEVALRSNLYGATAPDLAVWVAVLTPDGKGRDAAFVRIVREPL